MSRSVKEWVGKSDSTAVPPRVRLRNFEQHKGMCHLCGTKITVSDKWQTDHIIALINGGLNAERNIAPAHDSCHKAKTAGDVAEKKKVAKVRGKHFGTIRAKSALSSTKSPKPPLTKTLPPRALFGERS